jgi:hypothetical protein
VSRVWRRLAEGATWVPWVAEASALGLVVVAVASGVGQLAPVLGKQVQVQVHDVEVVAALVGAALFGLCLWLTARQQVLAKPEDWYDARAVAESTRSMAWKYMMGAEPYVDDAGESAFIGDLHKLLNDAQKTRAPSGSDIRQR